MSILFFHSLSAHAFVTREQAVIHGERQPGRSYPFAGSAPAWAIKIGYSMKTGVRGTQLTLWT
ncbi:hypothetical protein [Sphingobium sp. SA916]|uniref:hypothetical protein n=1 Tax=Sphingobium sp. SA916 TaxID=1851207 RepID=UPI000C9FF96D|nr:hypothetical protein [Sphingobium sp. SA916]PNQ04256.1 hypothetical protein A8G00_08445 [Sphingobium sp. SA916]